MFAIGDRVRLTREVRDEFDPSCPSHGEVIGILKTRDGRTRVRLRMDRDKWGKRWELDFKLEELERERSKAA